MGAAKAAEAANRRSGATSVCCGTAPEAAKGVPFGSTSAAFRPAIGRTFAARARPVGDRSDQVVWALGHSSAASAAFAARVGSKAGPGKPREIPSHPHVVGSGHSSCICGRRQVLVASPSANSRRPRSTSKVNFFVLETGPIPADRTDVRSALSWERSALRCVESALLFLHSPWSRAAHCGANGLPRDIGSTLSSRGVVDPCTSMVSGRNSGASRIGFIFGVDGRAARIRLSPSRVSGGSPRIPDMKCAAGLALVVTHPGHPSASPPRGFSRGVGSGHLPLARLWALLRLHPKRIVADGCDGADRGEDRPLRLAASPLRPKSWSTGDGNSSAVLSRSHR